MGGVVRLRQRPAEVFNVYRLDGNLLERVIGPRIGEQPEPVSNLVDVLAELDDVDGLDSSDPRLERIVGEPERGERRDDVRRSRLRPVAIRRWDEAPPRNRDRGALVTAVVARTPGCDLLVAADAADETARVSAQASRRRGVVDPQRIE